MLVNFSAKETGHMPEDHSGQVTALLLHWKEGDQSALRALVPLVYKELRRLAHYHLQSERPDPWHRT